MVSPDDEATQIQLYVFRSTMDVLPNIEAYHRTINYYVSLVAFGKLCAPRP